MGDGQYVTINVSPRHFRSTDLARQLLDLLARHVSRPHACLRVEVTEGALLENPEQVSATLAELREAGVLAALDDFGTGYSSLSYLHRFPLHALKIDRSFVAACARATRRQRRRSCARCWRWRNTLGMEVIAEGIETAGAARVPARPRLRAGPGLPVRAGAAGAGWLARMA